VRVPVKYTAFDANTAQPGVMFGVGGELGIFPRVSVLAVGQLGLDGENGTNGGAIAGLRFQVMSGDIGRLRLVGNVHGEHILAGA
jgi:hypothetical protein